MRRTETCTPLCGWFFFGSFGGLTHLLFVVNVENIKSDILQFFCVFVGVFYMSFWPQIKDQRRPKKSFHPPRHDRPQVKKMEGKN